MGQILILPGQLKYALALWSVSDKLDWLIKRIGLIPFNQISHADYIQIVFISANIVGTKCITDKKKMTIELQNIWYILPKFGELWSTNGIRRRPAKSLTSHRYHFYRPIHIFLKVFPPEYKCTTNMISACVFTNVQWVMVDDLVAVRK